MATVIGAICLAAELNNGDEHFDHGPQGYSWLCLACARNGRGPFVVTAAEMFDRPTRENLFTDG